MLKELKSNKEAVPKHLGPLLQSLQPHSHLSVSTSHKTYSLLSPNYGRKSMVNTMVRKQSGSVDIHILLNHCYLLTYLFETGSRVVQGGPAIRSRIILNF